MKRIAFFTTLLIVVAALAMGCGLTDLFNPSVEVSPEATQDMKNAMNLILRKFDKSVDDVLNAEDYIAKRDDILEYRAEAEEYYSGFKILIFGLHPAPEKLTTWKEAFLKRFDVIIERLDVLYGIQNTDTPSSVGPVAGVRFSKLVDIEARILG